MKGLVVMLGLACGCRQVLGFDDVVSPTPASDAPGIDAPIDVDAPPPPVGNVRAIDIVDAKVVGGPHADFPLLVSLSDGFLRSTSNGGDVASDAGFDIVFTADQAGTSRLAHEIDSYDPVDGRLVAWVKIPSLTATTVLFVYYGDPSITTSQENTPAVWSGGYAGVWHLASAGDATGQSAPGTETNTPAAVGKVGGARDFNGVDSHIVVAPTAATTDVFIGGGTIEAWVHPRTAGENMLGRIVDKAGSFLLGRGDTLVNNCLLFSYSFSMTPANWRSPQGSFQKNAFFHVAAVYDATSTDNVPKMFVDGIEVGPGNQDPAGVTTSDGAVPLIIGNQTELDRTFDGIIDEVWLSRTMRTADWIATEHANQREPMTFYTVGASL